MGKRHSWFFHSCGYSHHYHHVRCGFHCPRWKPSRNWSTHLLTRSHIHFVYHSRCNISLYFFHFSSDLHWDPHVALCWEGFPQDTAVEVTLWPCDPFLVSGGNDGSILCFACYDAEGISTTHNSSHVTCEYSSYCTSTVTASPLPWDFQFYNECNIYQVKGT